MSCLKKITTALFIPILGIMLGGCEEAEPTSMEYRSLIKQNLRAISDEVNNENADLTKTNQLTTSIKEICLKTKDRYKVCSDERVLESRTKAATSAFSCLFDPSCQPNSREAALHFLKKDIKIDYGKHERSYNYSVIEYITKQTSVILLDKNSDNPHYLDKIILCSSVFFNKGSFKFDVAGKYLPLWMDSTIINLSTLTCPHPDSTLPGRETNFVEKIASISKSLKFGRSICKERISNDKDGYIALGRQDQSIDGYIAEFNYISGLLEECDNTIPTSEIVDHLLVKLTK
jgi:hypothetical protein